jgi:hypothetical protein
MITESQIDSVSTANGAGIGSGSTDHYYSDYSSSNVTNMVITRSRISARACEGAGIGAGSNFLGSQSSPAQLMVTNAIILSSIIDASSSSVGAGIGGSFYGPVTNLAIVDSEITANSTSGASIGSGYRFGNVSSLSFTGLIVLTCYGSRPKIDAESIVITSCSIVVSGLRPPLFNITPVVNKRVDFTMMYDEITTNINEHLPTQPGQSLFQIGEVSLLMDWIWDICVWSPSYSRCFTFNSIRSRSFLVSLSASKTYILSASVGSIYGRLDSGTQSSFFVDASPLFVSKATFVRLGSPTPGQSPIKTASVSQSPTPSVYSNPLSVGAVAGIAVGSASLIVVICVVISCCVKRRGFKEMDLRSAIERSAINEIGTALLPSPADE